MSITKESKPESKAETPEQVAIRHAELRLEDWERLEGACGVDKTFKDASLSQYQVEEKELWKNQLRAGGWIFTRGEVGTGKTHLLSALVRSRYIWAWSCWLIYVPKLLADLKASYKDSKDSAEDILWKAENVDFLALDDLGTEKLTEWSQEIITNVINARYSKAMATAISSNYDLDFLAKRYERVADRIREKALIVPLEEKRPERGG